MKTHINEHAANDLDLYAENTRELHGQFNSIIANIKRKIRTGRYSPILAPKLWMYWYDAAAARYVKEFGGGVREKFPKALREHLAAERARDEYKKIKNGEYDHIR